MFSPGVITPYRGMVALLQKKLPAKVEVNTVDAFQVMHDVQHLKYLL